MSDLAVTFDPPQPYPPHGPVPGGPVPGCTFTGDPARRPGRVRAAAVLLFVLAGVVALNTAAGILVAAFGELRGFTADRGSRIVEQLPYTVLGVGEAAVLVALGFAVLAGRRFARYAALGMAVKYVWEVLSAIAGLASTWAFWLEIGSSRIPDVLWPSILAAGGVTVPCAVLAVFLFRALVSEPASAWFAARREPAGAAASGSTASAP